MFGHKKHPPADHVIGASMQVAGNCLFQGTLQLDGTIVGDLIADNSGPSSIRIGPSAQVEGAVQADHIIIAGTVIGPVTAKQRLELQPTARIEGNVSYQAMDMQAGATVVGAFQPQVITPPVQAQAKTEPSVPDPAEPEQAQEPTEPTLDPQQPLGAE